MLKMGTRTMVLVIVTVVLLVMMLLVVMVIVVAIAMMAMVVMVKHYLRIAVATLRHFVTVLQGVSVGPVRLY